MTTFKECFLLGGRKVGAGAPVLIIAEAGVAHFGDAGKARDLVDLAAEAGADVFKTQAFVTDDLISARLPEWRDRLRPKEVGFDFIAAMKQRCDDKGLIFLCTAHDETALEWVDRLEVPAYKVGSGERGNTPSLRRLAERGKPMIISTGMYTAEHVREALDAVAAGGCDELALLHCVTSYPTPADQVNLRAMETLGRMFPGPVGYSDHTRGHTAVLAAVARGAAIVEKHITLDFDVPNAQDWKVSCGPADLTDFVRSVREVEAFLGRPDIAVQPCEEPALGWALKSLVAARALPCGHVIASGDLVARRPGDGLPPSDLDRVVGCRLSRALAADEPLVLSALESA